MKKIIFTFGLILYSYFASFAQCAMCKASVESNTNANSEEVAQGFNSGILILMILPYVLMTGIVLLIVYFYKKRKEKESMISE